MSDHADLPILDIPTGRLRINPIEPKTAQIDYVDKVVDHANGIVLDSPVFQALLKQRPLSAINPFNEAFHPIPRHPWRIIPRKSQKRAGFHTWGNRGSDSP